MPDLLLILVVDVEELGCKFVLQPRNNTCFELLVMLLNALVEVLLTDADDLQLHLLKSVCQGLLLLGLTALPHFLLRFQLTDQLVKSLGA